MTTRMHDDAPEAWARALRAVLRRAHRNQSPDDDRARLLQEATGVLRDCVGRDAVTSEQLLRRLAGRIAALPVAGGDAVLPGC